MHRGTFCGTHLAVLVDVFSVSRTGMLTAFASRLTKTISSIKRRCKARNLAPRVVTRDEDDGPMAGKRKGSANSTAEWCPVCMQDVEGDPDVVSARIDACLVQAELHQPGSTVDGDAPLNIDDY